MDTRPRPRNRRGQRGGSRYRLSEVFQHRTGMDHEVPFSPHGRWGHIYAALDLGTNNCRLLIARPQERGFTVIDAFSRTVCLGEGVGASGLLRDAPVERTISALKTCVGKMERRRVTIARSIATEACRSARNGADFVARVERDTGLQVDVISPAEEARLAVTGCWPLVDRDCDSALVFDIGGGSTELIWLDLSGPCDPGDPPRIKAWTSLPCGVVSLAELYGAPHLEPARYGDMVEDVRARLSAFDGADELRKAFDQGSVHLLGTSGTVTTIAGLDLGLRRYDRDRVDGVWLPMDRVREICDEISGQSFEQRVGLPCVGLDRADYIVAGCAILEAIADLWPSQRLRVADRGLREGMLLTLMAEADRAARAGPRHRG